jgi:hypothetical protein
MIHSNLTRTEVREMIDEKGRIDMIAKVEETRKQFFEGAITSQEYLNKMFWTIAEGHKLIPTDPIV